MNGFIVTKKKTQNKNFYSSAFILLTQSEWLITKKEEFASANKIYIDELSGDYDITNGYAERLIDFLKIKKRPLGENDNAAKSLKFKNAEEAEKARAFYEKYYSKYSDELEKREAKTVFPTSNSANPERRAKKIANEPLEPKTYETKERSVRTSSSKDSEPYLQEKYTNDDNRLVCQICKREMPFRKKDGDYYFERIEIFSRTDFLDIEKGALHLALCPVCAAKYSSGGFVDDYQKNKIKEKILNENIEANKDGNYEIPILLDYETTICFVETHFIDLKAILKKSSPPNKPEIGEK
jgi:hypothetical protein